MRRPPPSSCRTTSTNSDSQTAARAHRHGRSRRRRRRTTGLPTVDAMQEPFKGFAGRAVRRNPARGGLSRDPPSSGRCRRRLRRLHPSRGDVVVGPRARAAGGRVPLRSASQPLDVVDRIASGDVYTQRLTFPEGLTIDEMAKVFEARGFGPARAFSKAAGDGALVEGSRRRRAISKAICFPKPTRCRAAQMRRAGRDDGRSIPCLYDDTLRARAEAQQLTTRQVVTLASLVEKETARAEERPLVAAVYRNRLKHRHGDAGRSDGHLRAAEGGEVRRQHPA